MPEPRLGVDPDDPTPPYEQVRRQILALVEQGALRPGDRLPSLRQLAGDLGLAVGTVGRAYAELEAAGVLVSRRGAGTRVALDPPLTTSPRSSGTTQDDLDALAREYLRRATALGASAEEAAAALARIRP